MWRTHSCVPRRHSCRRLEFPHFQAPLKPTGSAGGLAAGVFCAPVPEIPRWRADPLVRLSAPLPSLSNPDAPLPTAPFRRLPGIGELGLAAGTPLGDYHRRIQSFHEVEGNLYEDR